MPGRDKTTTSPADKVAHYHGHRQRLRQRFLAAGSEAISDYEMLELILFRAIPQRDVKPLAKNLLAAFGSFSEVIAAPAERLKEVDGLGEAAITELKIVQAAANRLVRGEVKQRQVCRHGRTCSTIAAPPWPSRARSTSAFYSSTKATTSSPTSSTRPAPSITPRSIRARSSSARSNSPPPPSSWCTTIPPAIPPLRAPTST